MSSPRKTVSPTTLAIAIGLSLMIAACSSAATAPEPTLPDATAASPAAPTTRPKTIAELSAEIEGQLLGELVALETDYEGMPGRIFARWDIAMGDTNEAIIDGARQDSVAILGSIARSGIEYEEVWLSGWYTITIDINLNTEHTEMVSLFYNRATLEPRNWDGLRHQFIWVISDGGHLHWLFTE